MPRTRLALAACLLAAPVLARAADDEGFRPLFNGKDLAGWVTPEDKGLFTVADGEIVARTRGNLKKNEFLATDRNYKDFVLKARVKFVSEKGNSGIQVRSARAENGAVAGPQVDIAPGYWGVLYDEKGKRGIIERYPPDKAAKLVREQDWNDFVVTMKGDHLKVDLNGTTILDREDPLFPKDGIIGLQVHVGPPMEVRFKDLQIKALD